MTMTSFPGSTFSWQSNIYTYAFIYYNLHPVPKGGGGLGSSVPVPCCPCLVSHIAPRRSYHHPPASSWQLSTSSHPIILHLPPANSHGVTSNQQKVLPLCYFLPYHTHNRLIFSLISPWVLTPQGSHAHFAVHLVRFSSHMVQSLDTFGTESCSIPNESRTHPEGRRSHENKPKNDLERPKIHLNPINFTVFRPKTKFAFFTPIPLSGVFYPKPTF